MIIFLSSRLTTQSWSWKTVKIPLITLIKTTPPRHGLLLGYLNSSESKVLHYFNIVSSLFFKLQQKQSSFQNRSHRVAPSEATFLPFLSHADSSSCPSRRMTPSLKLLSLLGCWSVAMRAGNELWLWTSNNPKELGTEYMLGVVSVWFPRVHGVQFSKLACVKILQNFQQTEIFIQILCHEWNMTQGQFLKLYLQRQKLITNEISISTLILLLGIQHTYSSRFSTGSGGGVSSWCNG